MCVEGAFSLSSILIAEDFLCISLYLYAYSMTSFCSSLLLISAPSLFSHSVIIDVFTQRDWDER